MQKADDLTDPLHHAIIDLQTIKPVGTIALMRIDPVNGVIEVGHVCHSPLLQKSRAGTEAMFSSCTGLLMNWAIAATNGNATASISPHDAPPNAMVFNTKAPFARRLSTRAAPGTRRGSPSSIVNGQSSVPPSSNGYLRKTSTKLVVRNGPLPEYELLHKDNQDLSRMVAWQFKIRA